MQGAVFRANAGDLLGHSRDTGAMDEVGLVLVGEVLESEVFGLGKEEGREKARKHDWG
jgi:transcription-repair coupling factor (superfamily II helicase)